MNEYSLAQLCQKLLFVLANKSKKRTYTGYVPHGTNTDLLKWTQLRKCPMNLIQANTSLSSQHESGSLPGGNDIGYGLQGLLRPCPAAWGPGTVASKAVRPHPFTPRLRRIFMTYSYSVKRVASHFNGWDKTWSVTGHAS